MLDVLVLGPVIAHEDGRGCPLGGAKQRALLARLTVARGRPVPPGRLIAELWDDSPPRDPSHALQARISRLRSAIPAPVEWVDGGYRLDPSGVQTDSARFEQLYEHGGQLLADGQLAQAADSLHEALGLWRGRAFAGIPEIATLKVESVRLEKLRSQALADRIDVDLAVGRSTAVIPELHALVEQHPLFERHWGQLMTALYCTGRMPEALEVFAKARAVFTAVLGVEPSTELARLHTHILREHPAGDLLHLPVAFPVLDQPDGGQAVHTTLSDHSVTSNQLDEVIALLRNRRALILTGPAGIGKTHLLRAVRAHFEARHCVAPLLSASTLSQAIPLGVFSGLGDPVSGEPATPAGLIDHFSRHRSTTVLLVDNVDQLDETSLFVVTQLIRASRLPAIVTVRDLVRAPDEIRALYDSGELTEAAVGALADTDADELVARLLGEHLTPSARPRILETARGNPFHLREMIAGSLADGRLARTEHGWELRGAPAPSPRLTQLVGERFSGLDDACLDAAAMVAIAGEFPADAFGGAERKALARTDVLAYATNGWLQLSHPLDAEFLRARSSAVLWRDLTGEVVRVLIDRAADRPEALRRAHLLALDLDQPIDATATLQLAEHALTAFDERLALRAAERVATEDPTAVHAHRVAGLAASSLGMVKAADTHFESARQASATSAERTAVALAHAQHVGVNHHDAPGALAIIQEALHTTDDADETAHLGRAAMRWAAVAGLADAAVAAPADTPDAAATYGLITAGVSGVITGPLDDAVRILALLRRVPGETLDLVPGGASLIELTEIMALSNNGDVLATRLRLQQKIGEARTQSPESLGMWEYALGFAELMSGDANRAYELGVSAAAHLEWRDATGLLPAARALAGAAAQATHRASAARQEFAAVPEAAGNDPKVVMLSAWARAWQERMDGNPRVAARTLLDTAEWLLKVQHSFFAGMLAHCAARIGEHLPDAVEVIGEAKRIAGGGLLEMFARHIEATIAGDRVALGTIATEANELGMASTAADTWRLCDRMSDPGPSSERGAERRPRSTARRYADLPGMALWGSL